MIDIRINELTKLNARDAYLCKKTDSNLYLDMKFISKAFSEKTQHNFNCTSSILFDGLCHTFYQC